MPVFPYIGSYGYSGETDAPGVLRVYPDLGFRFYKRATVDKDMVTLVFKRYNQTKFDAIRAFFKANRFNSFTVYDPSSGVTAVDPTGASAPGRHTAIFAADDGSPPKLTWSSIGRCVYDIEVSFIFLT
jgi:hypothetical protein